MIYSNLRGLIIDKLKTPIEVRNDKGKVKYILDTLPKTKCDIKMPPIKWSVINGDRICNTCIKEDVCIYKGELAQAAKEITKISERENVFIDTDIKCKKWDGKVRYNE